MMSQHFQLFCFLEYFICIVFSIEGDLCIDRPYNYDIRKRGDENMLCIIVMTLYNCRCNVIELRKVYFE